MIRNGICSVLFLSVFFCGLTSFAIPVEVSNAPQSNQALTINSIRSAQSSISLNIYELSSPEIADALIGQIKAGVTVSILEEGSPVGGMSTAAKGIESEIVSAMAAFPKDHFYQMGGGTSAKRRYRFDHAKYAVIDEQFLLIGSENYSPTGNPSPGTLGNRGWEIFTQDPSLAQEYKQIFATDSSTQFGDVADLTKHAAVNTTSSRPLKSAGMGAHLDASQIVRITSPDTSLNGLVGLINQARKNIEIEQMTFDSTWNKQAGASPLYVAILNAARRGVHVRVLLNDSHVFDHPGKPAAPHNLDTIKLYLGVGNLEARTANLKAMGVDYIHNKGMLVDGTQTLISSINWDQNSIQSNREAAVAITSPQVNQYYEALFNQDWQASGGGQFEMVSEPLVSSVTLVKDCPSAVHLEAIIGKLNVTDHEDQDFSALSGKKISDEFVLSPSATGCVLMQKSETHSSHERLTLEIRNRGDSKLVSLEGYTQKSGKLFSIRTTIKALNPKSNFTATVYDGSGPGREALGTASLQIETNSL